uniref:6-phosphogluconolactonase n=1 Tax=Onchocerca volvulus TaxID=6282 RepID=A0A8R1XRH1_ONCVO
MLDSDINERLSNRGKVIVVGNFTDLNDKLGLYMREILKKAIAERNCANIAVSGGSMPTLIAPLLTRLEDIDWSKVRIFAADERMVPLNDTESNTGAYMKILPSNISQSFVHYGPIDNTVQCAKNYEEQIHYFTKDTEEGWPIFDLLLLGIGPDGHTCSLFPEHPLLRENVKWVAAIEDSPKLPPRRITLTLPVINHARYVAFISTGRKKGELIRGIINGQNSSFPAAMVKPKSGNISWFMDKEAFAAYDGSTNCP